MSEKDVNRDRPGVNVIRNLGGNPLESETFRDRVAFLHETEFWQRGKLQALQVKELQGLIQHVGQHVPFYQAELKRLNLTWESFQTLDDLRRLPIIDKQTVQENYDRFVTTNVDKDKLAHRSTGGSSGNPLTIYMNFEHIARDKANTEYYMNVAGLNIFDHKSVRLYGDRIPEDRLAKGEYWLDDGRMLTMSCYHAEDNTLDAYLGAMEKHQPRYVHTRPSAVLPLATLMLKHKRKPPASIEAVFTDGEFITDGQRQTITDAFSARLYNTYGHTEGCLVGITCQKSNNLHFLPQVGILELLDRDNNPVTTEGGRGTLVATGFNNKVFPLIRYSTGDVGIHTNTTCVCGRHYPMLQEIEGRQQDYVVDGKGHLVPLAPAIFNYNDMDWVGIREFQVVQKERGRLAFHILPETGFEATSDWQTQVKARLEGIFGGGFTIDLRLVESIPRTRIGKRRYLEQHLDLGEFWESR